MAQTKSSSKSTKSSNKASKSATPSSKASSSSKSKFKRPLPKQQKTRPNLHNPSALKSSTKPSKRKAPQYTDKQLGLPALNAITPANAAPSAPYNLNSRGKKRKVFVDDEESMRTILSIVQAEKEGAIESKVLRMRRMGEIREARRVEQEKREQKKTRELEDLVEGLKSNKRKRKRENRKPENAEGVKQGKENQPDVEHGGKRKKVAFA